MVAAVARVSANPFGDAAEDWRRLAGLNGVRSVSCRTRKAKEKVQRDERTPCLLPRKRSVHYVIAQDYSSSTADINFSPWLSISTAFCLLPLPH